MKRSVIPTGIQSLDSIIKGGFPSGSLILLLGEVGTGNVEFAYTTLIQTAKKIKQEKSKIIEKKQAKTLNRVNYLTFTRSKDDILTEFAGLFQDDNIDEIANNISFKDFSNIYYQGSVAPESWILGGNSENTLFDVKGIGNSKNLLKELINYLEYNAQDSLIVINSLTNLVRTYANTAQWNDLILFIEMLQRISKKWDGIIYLVLGSKIFDLKVEEEIADCVDGVLVFEWSMSGKSKMQQTMYIKKFQGLLPEIAKDNIMKFEVSIDNITGFKMTSMTRISDHG